MLYILQEIINKQLDAPSFRCGCKCLSCCDWVPIRSPNGTTTYIRDCYNATADRPCSPYAACTLHDTQECGYLYSTADQVGFCEVKQPPLWPALIQIPRQQYLSTKYPEIMPDQDPPPAGDPPLYAAPMMYAASDSSYASQLMDAMWLRNQSITDAVLVAYLRAQSAGRNLPSSTENRTIVNETDFVDAADSLSRGLYEFGLVMGTSSFTSVTMLMEPAFVASSSKTDDGATSRPPLYFLQRNCSELSADDVATLERIGEAITNMTGFPVKCVSVPSLYQSQVRYINDAVYCGWLSSNCVVRNRTIHDVPGHEAITASNPIQEFVSGIYDWGNTNDDHFQVSVWVNNTNVARDPGVPDIQRWSQPVNMAANAYIKKTLGTNVSARLSGVRDMPKGATRLSLDFSSLLGPLFIMWFMQLMLPINVYMLVHEKERHLRIMMRMQGLRDEAYYVVQYIWMVAMYCVFMVVFVGFGSAIGLKIFTLNSYGVQFVFYFAWGNVLSAFSFYFAAWQRESRTAVLLAVVYVIITGFVANLVLVQYVEQGPPLIATLLELLPAFGLFRGLYELAQYAFLADRNGGRGLTWSKLLEPGCGMLQVLFYFLLEWTIFPVIALYIEQVTGAGTGVKKHPLFFLGIKHKESSSSRLKNASPLPSKDIIDAASMAVAKSHPSTPITATVAATPASLQSPMEYYYGSSGNLAPAASPHLPLVEQNTAATLPEIDNSSISPSAATVDATTTTNNNNNDDNMVAGKRPSFLVRMAHSVHRKASSVRLSIASTFPRDRTIAGNALRPRGHVEEGDSEGDTWIEEGPDVAAERSRVAAMWQRWCLDPTALPTAAILLHELRKVYPSRHGASAKVAVHDLSLGIDRCECFGLLGPNGAGKTTTIRMMEGFLDPSSGAAIIEGMSIPSEIHSIYSIMGACPQHDLLWEGLTGREHLLFYGRIKNLGGNELQKGVDDGLRSVNLLSVGNDLVSSYSGGMKRRLSVAIALMGDPKVVYLDEPSTGLDPSSRRLLWGVIKKARKSKAVVLTTHSMEEAEALCDRLGIFVNGRLQCIGNPKDLTARFGGYLSFTLTTPPHQEAAATAVVHSMSPKAKLVYALGGTQKFELPLTDVQVDGVFRRMEEVKLRKELELLDWGVSNATLEEVFIKITRESGVKVGAFT